jgi:site-specific DNA recombinase
VHKGTAHPGEHAAIISPDLWDKVHAILQESPRKRTSKTRAQTPALLKGMIFGPSGHAMVPTHTRRRGRLYRYYVSTAVLKSGRDACPVGRIPAGEIEAAVIGQVRHLLTTPEVIVRTWKAAREQDASVAETEVRDALLSLDPLWDELFPAEQARIVQLLVARVDVGQDGIDISLRTDGLTALLADLKRPQPGWRQPA